MEEGEYVNGRLNGQGKVTFVDGRIEEGDFVDDELVKGTATFDDGYKLEGEYVNGYSMSRAR